MGAKLILIGRDSERLYEVKQEILKQAPNVIENNFITYSIDLSLNLRDLSSIIEDGVSRLGKIHGFIHAAGIEKTLPISAMKDSDYENIFKVNVISGFELAKTVSKKNIFLIRLVLFLSLQLRQ